MVREFGTALHLINSSYSLFLLASILLALSICLSLFLSLCFLPAEHFHAEQLPTSLKIHHSVQEALPPCLNADVEFPWKGIIRQAKLSFAISHLHNFVSHGPQLRAVKIGSMFFVGITIFQPRFQPEDKVPMPQVLNHEKVLSADWFLFRSKDWLAIPDGIKHPMVVLRTYTRPDNVYAKSSEISVFVGVRLIVSTIMCAKNYRFLEGFPLS